MTEAQFVKNHRGIDQGKDPAKELLEGMYRRIKVRLGVLMGSGASLRIVLLPSALLVFLLPTPSLAVDASLAAPATPPFGKNEATERSPGVSD